MLTAEKVVRQCRRVAVGAWPAGQVRLTGGR